MKKLSPEDLYSLEEYARVRSRFRAEVMAHKRNRRLAIGANATLYFEDRLTMQYQVQEMLRAERIFEPQGIADELAAYNPLIPDGSNWKATFMLEYADVEERRLALERMVGIEDRVWVQVEDLERVWAVADEDSERETESKTSAVHFLRFELTSSMVRALRAGAPLAAGIDLDAYRQEVNPVPDPIRQSLISDLK